MTYKFVTREEFTDFLKQSCLHEQDGKSVIEDLVYRLLAECDAFREVAIKDHSLVDPLDRYPTQFIDAEAARLLDVGEARGK